MVRNHQTGALMAFDFDHLFEQIPELNRLDVELDSLSFEQPIDSSEMTPQIWIRLADLIETHYEHFDGFVVLHGSDTMAYSASALSFMLQGLRKPVILTGSQLPIGTIRTDGKENFITSVEIAALCDENDEPIVQEVAIYFEYSLYRGNRTSKVSASEFEAFRSPNHPDLARAGVEIAFNRTALFRTPNNSFKVYKKLDSRIVHLSLFPGISFEQFESMLQIEVTKGLVLSTFGSGNGPNDEKMTRILSEFVNQGGLILNISQCLSGSVQLGKYEASKQFLQAGVLGGGSLTPEAALTKMMFVLGNWDNPNEQRRVLTTSLCGEM